MAQRYYGNAVWTNHALEKLEKRGLSQDLASQTFQNPDEYFHGKQAGTWEYQKQFGPSKVTVIAKKNEKDEWIILSCWTDPPLPGTEDEKKKRAYQKYQKMGFWSQLWSDIKRDLFGIGY